MVLAAQTKKSSWGSLPVCSPRSCSVPPEVSEASRSPEEVFFQGNTTYTSDREYIVSSLKVIPNFVVDFLLFIPPLVPRLLWCMGRVSCFLVILVTPQIRESAIMQRERFRAPVSSSPVMCIKPEFGNVERRLETCFNQSGRFHNHWRDIWSYISGCCVKHPVIFQRVEHPLRWCMPNFNSTMTDRTTDVTFGGVVT